MNHLIYVILFFHFFSFCSQAMEAPDLPKQKLDAPAQAGEINEADFKKLFSLDHFFYEPLSPEFRKNVTEINEVLNKKFIPIFLYLNNPKNIVNANDKKTLQNIFVLSAIGLFVKKYPRNEFKSFFPFKWHGQNENYFWETFIENPEKLFSLISGNRDIESLTQRLIQSANHSFGNARGEIKLFRDGLGTLSKGTFMRDSKSLVMYFLPNRGRPLKKPRLDPIPHLGAFPVVPQMPAPQIPQIIQAPHNHFQGAQMAIRGQQVPLVHVPGLLVPIEKPLFSAFITNLPHHLKEEETKGYGVEDNRTSFRNLLNGNMFYGDPRKARGANLRERVEMGKAMALLGSYKGVITSESYTNAYRAFELIQVAINENQQICFDLFKKFSEGDYYLRYENDPRLYMHPEQNDIDVQERAFHYFGILKQALKMAEENDRLIDFFQSIKPPQPGAICLEATQNSILEWMEKEMRRQHRLASGGETQHGDDRLIYEILTEVITLFKSSKVLNGIGKTYQEYAEETRKLEPKSRMAALLNLENAFAKLLPLILDETDNQLRAQHRIASREELIRLAATCGLELEAQEEEEEEDVRGDDR